MFNCGVCLQSSAPREKASRIVIERRNITHPYISGAHKFKTSEGKNIFKDDPGGTGTSIVKEVMACVKCAEVSRKAELGM